MKFHNFVCPEAGWNLQSSESLFTNAYLEVSRLTVTSPTRATPFTWTLCHRKAAVVVAPRDTRGYFYLVRQERVPIMATIWEFPAGQIDHATGHDRDAIQDTGLRELREEAGLELADQGSVVCLGHFFPSCGFTDEHSHLLLADGVQLSASGARPDEAEAITECRAFSIHELRAMIASGEIRDANTLAAFARLTAMGLLD